MKNSGVTEIVQNIVSKGVMDSVLLMLGIGT